MPMRRKTGCLRQRSLLRRYCFPWPCRQMAVIGQGSDRIGYRCQVSARRGQRYLSQAVGPDTLTVLDASGFRRCHRCSSRGGTPLPGHLRRWRSPRTDGLSSSPLPTVCDRAEKKVVLGTYLQVIDLEVSPPRIVERIELGSHARARDGPMAAAGGHDAGSVAVLSMRGRRFTMKELIKLSEEACGARSPMMGRRCSWLCAMSRGLIVLDVDGDKVTPIVSGCRPGSRPTPSTSRATGAGRSSAMSDWRALPTPASSLVMSTALPSSMSHADHSGPCSTYGALPTRRGRDLTRWPLDRRPGHGRLEPAPDNPAGVPRGG